LKSAEVLVARIQEGEVRLIYARIIGEGKHYFLVLNNVASKLLSLIYAVVKSGLPYDPLFLAMDPGN